MIPVPNNPDPDLIRGSRGGDPAAFLQLVDRYTLSVLSVIEARRPFADGNEALVHEAWARILASLPHVTETHWFHRHCVRETRVMLDLKGLSVSLPGPDCPPFLAPIPIEQREALYFEQWAKAASPFPPHEHFGIAETAFDARLERARAALDRYVGHESTDLGEGPGSDFVQRVRARCEAELFAEKKRQKSARSLPGLPLPLAFLLAIAAAAIVVAVIFTEDSTTNAPAETWQVRELEAAARHELARRLVVETGPRCAARLAGPTTLELSRGKATVADDSTMGLRAHMGTKVFISRRGRFLLEKLDEGWRITVHSGGGILRDADGTKQHLHSGTLRW